VSRFCVAVVAVVSLFLNVAAVQAAFPGKNGRIVFSADCCVPTERFNDYLFTVDPSGTDLQRLPWPPGAKWATHPRWSPDGKRIAFVATTSLRPGGASTEQIWVADVDGANPFQVTHVSDPGTAAVTPAWSPDGRRIAYHWINRGIWTVNVDGTDNRPLLERTPPLADPFFFPSAPAWSPTGDLIAFTAYVDRTGPRRLMTVRPDGTDRKTVVAGEDNLADPSWSPDGKWIAYQGGSSISVVRPDGSDRRDLIAGAFGSPAWSPDGTQIALGCFCYGNGRTGIAAIDSDGSALRHVIQTPIGFSGFPDWQPIPSPKRTDFKNSNKFCKAEQDFWGDQFAARYGGGANAFGKCVSQNH
jgi:Tol biopolymer transport system component